MEQISHHLESRKMALWKRNHYSIFLEGMVLVQMKKDKKGIYINIKIFRSHPHQFFNHVN
jgi:hypothetical protein